MGNLDVALSNIINKGHYGHPTLAWKLSKLRSRKEKYPMRRSRHGAAGPRMSWFAYHPASFITEIEKKFKKSSSTALIGRLTGA